MKNVVAVVTIVVLFCVVATMARAGPLGKSKHRAVHVPRRPRYKLDLGKLFVWPNSYYDVPKHRYPYYDRNGKGKLLYGYGGQTLYKYSEFRPLEGYFK